MDETVLNSALNVGGVTLRALLENREKLVAPETTVSKDGTDTVAYDATAAFLGPNIWDKSYADLRLENIDLDALLKFNLPSHEQPKVADCAKENKVSDVSQFMQMDSNEETSQISDLQVSTDQQIVHQQSPSLNSPVDKDEGKKCAFSVEYNFSANDLALATPPGQEHYDPTTSVIPDEILKPQPIVKKSRKHFVPDNQKDAKYWARRRKNNVAAKRSREARRFKENQIVLRASYLEKENNSLKEDVIRLTAENDMLKKHIKDNMGTYP